MTTWMYTDKQFTHGVRPLADQLQDDESLYCCFRRLIHLRNRHPALSAGKLMDADLGVPGIAAFLRT
jgi:hypothetical protein